MSYLETAQRVLMRLRAIKSGSAPCDRCGVPAPQGRTLLEVIEGPTRDARPDFVLCRGCVASFHRWLEYRQPVVGPEAADRIIRDVNRPAGVPCSPEPAIA
jgi:hypothetical protein